MSTPSNGQRTRKVHNGKHATVAKRYLDALAAGDFAALAAVFTDDVAWHQPGANKFSGAHVGGAEISMDGVDVFRVEGERIAEVWLFWDAA